jgi:hypothetical protein
VSELIDNHNSFSLGIDYGDGIRFRQGVSFGDVDCDNPFYLEGENKKKYSRTKTIEVFNKSETKVYEVMIQFKNSGKVNYETFRIEPTQNLLLGCNFNFDADLIKFLNDLNTFENMPALFGKSTLLNLP